MTNYTAYTDSELINALREGNDAAFTEIYRRYWKRLFILPQRNCMTLKRQRKSCNKFLYRCGTAGKNWKSAPHYMLIWLFP